MKNKSLVVISVMMMGLFACKPEKPFEDKSAKAGLLGKWHLQRMVDEVYNPDGTLYERHETVTIPGDSVLFKQDGWVYCYSSELFSGVEEQPYRLVNDSTLDIEDELYKIRKLTDKEMLLYQRETDEQTHEINVQESYFVR